MDEVFDTATSDNGTAFRVQILTDNDAGDCNPRENDVNLGVMVVKNDHMHVVPAEGEMVAEIREAIEHYDFPTVARWLRIFHGATVVLPVTHRGLMAGSATDTDTVGNYFGVIYDTEDTRKVNGTPADQIEMVMWLEVSEYGDWAEGNVFGVIVEHGPDRRENPTTWEQADSLWGIIGSNMATDEAKRHLEDAVGLYDLRHPADVSEFTE